MKSVQFNILVIEDDANDRFLIDAAFRKLAVEASVYFVNDGEQGIAYLSGTDEYADRAKYPYPTFIMTDLKMPKMDGFAVLEHLKNHPMWAVIPTVVFSASQDLDDIKKAYMLGGSSYHVKPADSITLRAQLKILYDYWLTCEVPQIDRTGKQLITNSRGKLGERFEQPT